MKIAIDARMYGNEECTGIGTYIQKLTDELFKLDQANEYILFLSEPAFSRFNPLNERVRKAKVTARWYSYAEQWRLPLEFMKEKFDLIHYPHFNSPILYFKKSICTIHDITPIYFPGHKMSSPVRKLGYQTVFRATIRKATKILTPSDSTKREIIKHFSIDPEKIAVTHEGVDERFKIIENRGIINEVKNQFGLAKPYLFYVGVWRDHKNIEGLIKAFNLLKEKYRLPHQLVLGGREDLHYTLIRQAVNESPFKNDIITPGFIKDEQMACLYNAAAAFVLPSFIEGFGLIAIEAQACGCPVVCSNTSSLPEILGDSALFFNPDKPEEMSEQIYKILSNDQLREELTAKGLANVKRFSWRKCAEKTLNAYHSV